MTGAAALEWELSVTSRREGLGWVWWCYGLSNAALASRSCVVTLNCPSFSPMYAHLPQKHAPPPHPFWPEQVCSNHHQVDISHSEVRIQRYILHTHTHTHVHTQTHTCYTTANTQSEATTSDGSTTAALLAPLVTVEGSVVQPPPAAVAAATAAATAAGLKTVSVAIRAGMRAIQGWDDGCTSSNRH